MQKENKPGFLEWMVLLALVLVWGSSFILMKKSLVSFSPTELGALRITISFAVLLPFALKKILRVPVNQIKFFAITGIVGNTFPAFLFAIAQSQIDSYLAGVLNSPTTLFTLLIGVAFFSVKTRAVNVVGVVVGLAATIGLLTSVHGARFGGNAIFGLFVIVATICYALNINFVKKYLARFDSMTITSVSFAIIGIPATMFLLAGTGFVNTMKTDPESYKSLLYVAVLAVFGTAMSMVAFNWLIKRVTALFASTVTYMMPLVSIAWGMVDGERFLAIYMLWVLLILAGVFMTNIPASLWGKLTKKWLGLFRK